MKVELKMGELLLIVLAAALVNNFVLVQFLGLCPFMRASQRLEGAIGMALATGLVLTTASGLCFLVDRFVLQRFELQYLRILAFVAVVGASILLTNALVPALLAAVASRARGLLAAGREQLRAARRRAAELGREP